MSRLLLRTQTVLLILVAIFLGILGCTEDLKSIGNPYIDEGLLPAQGYHKGSASDLIGGQPTPMAPTRSAPVSQKSDVQSIGLSHPEALIDWPSKTLELRWQVKGSEKKLVMRGTLKNSQGRLWEATVSPINLGKSFHGIVKAKALCFVIDSCRHLGVDLYFLPPGSEKIIKQQFEAGKVAENKAVNIEIESARVPIFVEAEDEFKGSYRKDAYISPAPEEDFFSDFPKTATYVATAESQLDYEQEWLRAIKDREQELEKLREKRQAELKAIQEAAQKKKIPVEPPGAKKPPAAVPAEPEVKSKEDQIAEDIKRLEQAAQQARLDREALERRMQETARDRESQMKFQQEKAQAADGFVDLEGGGKSIQFVNDGTLENGEPVAPIKTKTYHALFAKHGQHYGSGMLVSLLKGVLDGFKKQYKKDVGVLQFNALSQELGGELPFVYSDGKHASHQNGLDADIKYLNPKKLSTYDKNSGSLNLEFPWQLNLDFFRYLVSLSTDIDGKTVSLVKFIFVHKDIKDQFCLMAKKTGSLDVDHEVHRRIRGISGHKTHFHLRLRCSPHYTGCRDQAEPVGTKCL